MISENDWQERAIELEGEGCEITVIGRPGRLEKERSGSLLRAAAAVRFTIELPAGTTGETGAGISGNAVVALSKWVEEVLKKAAARAHGAHREFITKEDVEEAWTEVSRSR